MGFIFSVYMVDSIDRLLCVESSLHLWDEAELIVGDFSDVFASTLLSIFVLMFTSEIGL